MRGLVSILVSVAGMFSALAEAPTNVVLILSDDQAWRDYGFMGNNIVQTPNLDALAERSAVYRKGYVVSPLCRPSLASIVSGLYPHEHGVVGNDVSPAKKEARNREDRPVVEAFHKKPSVVRFFVERGYLAFQSGKWWEGSWKDGGFSHGMTHGDYKKGGRHGDVGLKIGREGMEPIADFLDQAVSEEKPFFLWYAPFLPHTPHNPPEKYKKNYQNKNLEPSTATYYAMCEWFDDTCGKLLEMLEERRLSENTLIVYVCDNGWAAAEESTIELPDDWWLKYAPKSKGSPYEVGIRTPILFSLPGKLKSGDRDGFASSIDLFPTMVKLCGFDIPEGLSGIDLMAKERSQVIGAAYSIHNMTPGEPFDTLQYAWIREGRWKFLQRYHGSDTTKYLTVHEWDTAPIQLFDVERDPDEAANLADQNPGVVADFQRRLAEIYPNP